MFKKWFLTLWWMPEELQGSISDSRRTASLSRAYTHIYGLDMEKQKYGIKENNNKNKENGEEKEERKGWKSVAVEKVIMANGIYWIILKVWELLCRLFSCLN